MRNIMIDIRHGDCLAAMKNMPNDSIDAVVTDPPYELGFMGKSWDASGIAFCPDTWREVLRIMKPGAHLAAFGAPKNYHRLACAIEDAGFEIRDSLMWVFGTGFPKSHNISKSIDRAAGAEREVIGVKVRGDVQKAKLSGSTYTAADANKGNEKIFGYGVEDITIPATDETKQWDGWGTALKPAYEPIVLARKPLSEKTVAANVLCWGTGALNIDATRIETADNLNGGAYVKDGGRQSLNGDERQGAALGMFQAGKTAETAYSQPTGRWPANLCHDGSQQVLDLFPKDAGRFFYSAKASKTDRAGSKHPTVKPVSLMQWLVRMVTPPNGTVLDPFAGSGTTGAAARADRFDVILIEREAEYIADIKRRLVLESK
jgi:DNA modification methylase